jgi:hypothetical protein
MTREQDSKLLGTEGPSATDHREKPFRLLTKGKEWKKFEKVLEDWKAFNVPNTGVR